MSSIGVPTENSVTVKRFLTMRLRNRSMAGSSLGPSTPQFQLRLAPAPSQLFSPLASLCFALYETRSFRVKPSWQVTKLRSEEHTSELQSHLNLVCRLLLEKKKTKKYTSSKK